jgi:hypothetical protein
MKKNILISLAMLISSISFAQTTATNFNCNDCVGTNHDLFTELNSGKVIVLVWVMPCATCIAPSRTAYDDVQSYASSNPGRVIFYLVDDKADTPCNTLTSWGNTNGMPNAVKFSNATINPADYGNVGMPKIIVLGGTSHTVFYNEDDGNNLAGIDPAINQALASTGIVENNDIIYSVNVFSNTKNKGATIAFDLVKADAVSIDIIDITGKQINVFPSANQTAGKHEIQIDLGSFDDGLYFVKLNVGNTAKVVKFVLSN